MKWKIGAILMVVVFCLAIVPSLIDMMGAGSLSLPSLGGSQEFVMQEGNTRALLKGKEVSLGDSADQAVYRDEQGDAMVSLKGLADALGLEMNWNESSETAELSADKTTVTMTVNGDSITGGKEDVAVACALTADENGTLFVPIAGLAQAMNWGYAEDSSTASIVIDTKKKQIKDKNAQKAGEKAVEMLGVPRATLLKSSLVFRTDSDCVVQDGENVDLMDADEILYTPMIANDKYYLPAKAVAAVLGGEAKDTDDGVSLVIDDKTIELTDKGSAKVDGKNAKGDKKDVLAQDDVMYISSSLLAKILDYAEAGEGEICMIGSESFANADTQIAYLTGLGEALPDQRPAVPKADAYVAFTFDDGPTGGSSGLTVRLLNGLKERNAHATFFMCGYRIKDFHTHMNRYLAEGHELGNHTMDHPGLLTKKDYATIVDQVKSNCDLIKSYCGEDPSVFRPVGGGVNDDVKAAAKELGLPIINWSVDTLDWKYRNAEHIRSVIVDNAKDGDIVLMHDLRDCTLEGALAAIDELSQKGYAFVTVEELARIKGVKMEPGEVYTDFHDDTVEKIKNGTYEANY